MVEQQQITARECVSCRAGLDISQNMTRLVCDSCGATHEAESKGKSKAQSLRLVVDKTSWAQVNMNRSEAKKALRRFYDELYTLLERRSQVKAEVAAEISKQNSGTIKTISATLSAGLIPWVIIFTFGLETFFESWLSTVFWADIGAMSLICSGALIVRGSSIRLVREVLMRELEDFDSRIGEVQRSIARHEAIIEP